MASEPESFPAPVISVIRTNYPWLHNDVYSTDPWRRYPPERLMLTYTVAEFDSILFDKANKTGETTHGNIALLDGTDGDLVDSGVHPDDLLVCIVDAGTF